MSLGPTTTITVADIDRVQLGLDLFIEIINDPVGIKARSQDLADKIKDLDAKIQENRALSKAAADDRAAAEDAMDKTAATVVEADGRHSKREEDFQNQVAMLTGRTQKVVDREAAFDRDYQTRNAALKAREADIDRRERDVAALEARNGAEADRLEALRVNLEGRIAMIQKAAAA